MKLKISDFITKEMLKISDFITKGQVENKLMRKQEGKVDKGKGSV